LELASTCKWCAERPCMDTDWRAVAKPGSSASSPPQERRPSQTEQAAGLKRMRALQQFSFSTVHASRICFSTDAREEARRAGAPHVRRLRCACVTAAWPPADIMQRPAPLAGLPAHNHISAAAKTGCCTPGPFPAPGQPVDIEPCTWGTQPYPFPISGRAWERQRRAWANLPALQRRQAHCSSARQTSRRRLLPRMRRPGPAAQRARRTAAPRRGAHARAGTPRVRTLAARLGDRAKRAAPR